VFLWILAGIGVYLVLAILLWKFLSVARVRAVRRELLAGVMPTALTGSVEFERHDSPKPNERFGPGLSGPGPESSRSPICTPGRSEASVDVE
jgi:hypothetical protein